MSVCINSGVFRIWQRGGHGERVEREPITGVWGGALSGVQGQSPWSGGRSLMEAANLPIFLKFGNAENHNVISDAISHGDFNHILYQYEKRPSNIVEFCNSCWKTAKKRIFSYKVALKILWSGQRGAIAPWPSP